MSRRCPMVRSPDYPSLAPVRYFPDIGHWHVLAYRRELERRGFIRLDAEIRQMIARGEFRRQRIQPMEA